MEGHHLVNACTCCYSNGTVTLYSVVHVCTCRGRTTYLYTICPVYCTGGNPQTGLFVCTSTELCYTHTHPITHSHMLTHYTLPHTHTYILAHYTLTLPTHTLLTLTFTLYTHAHSPLHTHTHYALTTHSHTTHSHSHIICTHVQLVTSRSKLEARLSELQSQLTKTQQELTSLEDHNQQLSNQLSSQEAKMLKVWEREREREFLLASEIDNCKHMKVT